MNFNILLSTLYATGLYVGAVSANDWSTLVAMFSKSSYAGESDVFGLTDDLSCHNLKNTNQKLASLACGPSKDCLDIKLFTSPNCPVDSRPVLVGGDTQHVENIHNETETIGFQSFRISTTNCNTSPPPIMNLRVKLRHLLESTPGFSDDAKYAINNVLDESFYEGL
ncbi:hypothetical protein PHYSODRAFT_303515 [Phytophthora sojae]|uniref:Uncharacterized protein n=1 Tax=Phytophthora sojae (strain P6497) TaxID=1094619 RepID=G4ZS65_PHYSP|nr:hypothetical protein PHYSODRAFT_303515 [Phytophthora sojae]EGZ14361.1 hypothetical protein PHYSODRAFT_303515 [Phytophthora sojae]|eukprot:XP_009531790.1 hypothetical protein PHYSODRAFT_303515 [Phytophthora sojae]